MKSFASLLGDGPATGKSPNIVVARQTSSNISVGREGELVTLTITGTTVRFKHRDAMMIGQWLMAKAFEAKALVGDAQRVHIDKGRNRT
jgi:hypothetical protein